jgi:hypothetical protein
MEDVRRRREKSTNLIEIHCVTSANFFEAARRLLREGERKHGFQVTDSIGTGGDDKEVEEENADDLYLFIVHGPYIRSVKVHFLHSVFG